MQARAFNSKFIVVRSQPDMGEADRLPCWGARREYRSFDSVRQVILSDEREFRPQGTPPGGFGRRYPEGSSTAASTPAPAIKANTSTSAAPRDDAMARCTGACVRHCRLRSRSGADVRGA